MIVITQKKLDPSPLFSLCFSPFYDFMLNTVPTVGTVCMHTVATVGTFSKYFWKSIDNMIGNEYKPSWVINIISEDHTNVYTLIRTSNDGELGFIKNVNTVPTVGIVCIPTVPTVGTVCMHTVRLSAHTVPTVGTVFTAKPNISDKHELCALEWMWAKLGVHYHVWKQYWCLHSYLTF